MFTEESKHNAFDDLGVSDEESGTELNTVQFAKNQQDFKFSEMNDFFMNCDEEKSIEPIQTSINQFN